LLQPLSLASHVLRLFQLMPSHIEEALALVALALITVVSIAVAFTVEQPCAVGWRSASELRQWEQLPLGLTELIAADTIPIDRATELLKGRRQHAGEVAPVTVGGHLIDKSGGTQRGHPVPRKFTSAAKASRA
jgi:hypothetical protein